MNEDLYFASAQERKAQLPELRRARAEGKIAYFVHTRLVIREKRMETSRTTGAHDSPNQLTIPAATNTVVISDDGVLPQLLPNCQPKGKAVRELLRRLGGNVQQDQRENPRRNSKVIIYISCLSKF